MKTNFKRCLLCFCCLILALPILTVSASALTTKTFKGDPWNYIEIYAEDSEYVVPNTVIIYLHGDCHAGSHHIEDLEQLALTEHPYNYAKRKILPLPDDVLMVCPQNHSDGEFLRKHEKLYEFIHGYAEKYPDATIILGGHSRGGMTSYFVADKGNEDIDGYFFISTKKPEEAEQLNLMQNAFVAYGSADNVYRRHYFSNLFFFFDITEKQYAQETQIWDEITNNVYYVGPWEHGNAPLVILEDTFWEWISTFPISNLDDSSV